MGWFCNFSFTESHVKKDNFIESFIFFFPFISNLKKKKSIMGSVKVKMTLLNAKNNNNNKKILFLAQGKMQRTGVNKSRSLRY